MTTTQLALSQAPRLRGRFRGERGLFAPTPVPGECTADATTGTTAARSMTSPGCAEAGQRPVPAAAGIAPEDWDLLFRAALDLLAHVAIEKAAQAGNGRRLQASGHSLRECIEALDQLRRSAPPVQWLQRRKPGRAKGDLPPTGLDV